MVIHCIAGGPGQQPHLAPTYAAVNALCILATEEAYNIIDRYKCVKLFILKKLPKKMFFLLF